MKHTMKLLALLLVLCTMVGCIVACDSVEGGGTEAPAGNTTTELPEWVDYVSQVKLDMNSPTAKTEIPASDIKQLIDGDTTHFYVDRNISSNGVLKARYLAINTPESTGQIEEWGKKASNFTKEKLNSAVSIVIESDTSSWNVDSTGERFLVWIWYKTSADGEYINLNLQILQEGLAIASNSANNKYGDYCMKAINQAQAYKLFVYSGKPDPDFYYGEAQELTIKELRTNIADYDGTAVAFEGVVVKNSGMDGVYVEAYDEENGMYNGIYVYYGTSSTVPISMLKPGNKVRIVGTVSSFAGSYQVSGLKYDVMDPKNPANVQKLGEGFEASYLEVSPTKFATEKVTITVVGEDGEETVKEVPFAEMALSASISMNGLTVTKVYTTSNGGDSDGAMTLTCTADGQTISVRTSVLADENGKLVKEDYFLGKTIDIKGTVDYYNESYQIEVTSLKDITIK